MTTPEDPQADKKTEAVAATTRILSDTPASALTRQADSSAQSEKPWDYKAFDGPRTAPAKPTAQDLKDKAAEILRKHIGR